LCLCNGCLVTSESWKNRSDFATIFINCPLWVCSVMIAVVRKSYSLSHILCTASHNHIFCTNYGISLLTVSHMLFCVLLHSPTASKTKIKEAHKRIMLLNHPDRGIMVHCLFIFCWYWEMNELLESAVWKILCQLIQLLFVYFDFSFLYFSLKVTMAASFLTVYGILPSKIPEVAGYYWNPMFPCFDKQIVKISPEIWRVCVKTKGKENWDVIHRVWSSVKIIS